MGVAGFLRIFARGETGTSAASTPTSKDHVNFSATAR